MKILIETSIGELLDKISILSIKNEKDPDNLDIKKEYTILKLKAEEYKVYDVALLKELYAINKKLWDIEDKIRVKEKKGEFDYEFINLARLVYKTNDERFEVKNEINRQFNSQIREVKLYK